MRAKSRREVQRDAQWEALIAGVVVVEETVTIIIPALYQRAKRHGRKLCHTRETLRPSRGWARPALYKWRVWLEP